MKTSTQELIDKLDEKNVKVVFCLEAQGHIQTIQAELEKWNNNEYNTDMTYSKHVWESIGKIIGWCPFTCALSYFKWLNEKK